MLTKRISLLIALILYFILILTYGCKAPASQKGELITTTLEIQQAVQSELFDLDLDILAASSDLRNTGLSGAKARRILEGLANKHPYIIDTCTVDDAGKMVTVAPDAYRSYEGTDISQQAVMVKFNETKSPILSQMFRAVEGVDGVVIIWRVLSQGGDFIGSIRALFRPSALFTMTVEQRLKNTGLTMNVMQLDGLNIYDSEGKDTGKNLFTDPSYQPYPDLIALGNRMVYEESSLGSYTYIDHATGKTVEKKAFWVSVGLHGTEWRLLCTEQATQ